MLKEHFLKTIKTERKNRMVFISKPGCRDCVDLQNEESQIGTDKIERMIWFYPVFAYNKAFCLCSYYVHTFSCWMKSGSLFFLTFLRWFQHFS